jgi:hypothetical protein
MLPQIAVDDHVGLHQVVGDRHARQFDDAALDCVDQAEIGDDPREKRSFGIARATKEKRCGREVVNCAYPFCELARQGFDTVDPKPRRLFILGGFLFVVAGQSFFGVATSLVPVAMVGFVVDDVDASVIEELAAGPIKHLSIGFRGLDRIRCVALQEAARDLRQRKGLPVLEGVVVGDDDLSAPDFRQHFRWDEFTGFIVVVRIARLKNAEAILDRDAGGDDQEGA